MSRSFIRILASPHWLLAFAALLVGSVQAVAAADPADRSAGGLQQLVDRLRAHLEIPHTVGIDIVETNPKLVSVARSAGAERPFHLAIEADFLDTLTDDELTAALAHELGHVWVSTHHPYLQTERLANDVALRVVTRDSLERLYGKMWARLGIVGDVNALLGSMPTVAASPDAATALRTEVIRTSHEVD